MESGSWQGLEKPGEWRQMKGLRRGQERSPSRCATLSGWSPPDLGETHHHRQRADFKANSQGLPDAD